MKNLAAVLISLIVFIPIAVIVMLRNGHDVSTWVMGLVVILLILRFISMFDPVRRERVKRKRPIWETLDNSKADSAREAMFLADVKNIANSSRIQNEPNVNSNGGEKVSLSKEDHGQTGTVSDTPCQKPDKSMPYSYMNGNSIPHGNLNIGMDMPDHIGTAREAQFFADINNIAYGRNTSDRYSSYSSSRRKSYASGARREEQFLADINEIANKKRAQNNRSSFSGYSARSDIDSSNKDTQF